MATINNIPNQLPFKSNRRTQKISRAVGVFLFDSHGDSYMECNGNISHVGQCHPRIVSKTSESTSNMCVGTRYNTHNIETYCGELCLKFEEEGLDVCFLVNSGSEANDLAVQLAKNYTHRNRVTVLEGAYHGHTTCTLEISPYKDMVNDSWVDVIELEKMTTPAIVDFEGKIGEDTAAFICESFPSCAGQLELPKAFVEETVKRVRDHGGLYVADEVQTGFGRIGSHYWGFRVYGVVPDIVTLGKSIANGYPMGAVVTRREIAESLQNHNYFNSCAGNSVACDIGLEVIRIVEDEKLQKNALEVGDYILRNLMDLKDMYPCIISCVRGRGLFIGIETHDSYNADRVCDILYRNFKILVTVDGIRRNVLKIKPAMVFSKQNADRLLTGLKEAMATIIEEIPLLSEPMLVI